MRIMQNYQIYFWLAGSLGIIAAERFFLSVGAIFKHFEQTIEILYFKNIYILKKSKNFVFQIGREKLNGKLNLFAAG